MSRISMMHPPYCVAPPSWVGCDVVHVVHRQLSYLVFPHRPLDAPLAAVMDDVRGSMNVLSCGGGLVQACAA